MKNKVGFLIFVLSLLLFMYLGTLFAYRSRASGVNLELKLKLQGLFALDTKIKLRVDVYNSTGKVAQFDNVLLNYTNNNLFEGLVILEQNLDLNVPYALFIKPENYLGQLFCSATKSGSSCQYPELILTNSLNQLDLSTKLFYAGDLAPQDGKVDSGDLSTIFANIGKTGPTADINLDKIVNGVDYALAQKTLSLNKNDDQITLEAPVTPTTPPGPTGSPPTGFPTPIPTTVPVPTSTPTPTPVPQSGRGRCNGIVTGQVRISYLGQTECRVLNETDYRCVDSASECTNAACVDFTKTEIRSMVDRCGYGMATFDESSPISCQASYTTDPSCQDPPEETSCDDNSQTCP